MNVLILGVNGFLGTAIAFGAVGKGCRVFGVSRSDAPQIDTDITYLRGNRTDHAGVLDLIRSRKIDIVVDVLPMTLVETRPLIDCLDKQVTQYVMLSSSDVYRNYELFQRKSEGTPVLDAVNEDAALRQTRFPYREQIARARESADRYLDDYDKIPIENAVQRMSSNWTILRLPMVYGPGDKQRRFSWVIKPIQNGERSLVIPRSWAHWCSTYGHIDNVAEAIALTLGNAKAENRIFNVGEQPSVNHLEWARRFAEVLNWSGEINLADDPDDPFTRRIAGLDLRVPFKVSSNRIREELGFKEVVDQGQALLSTASSESRFV